MERRSKYKRDGKQHTTLTTDLDLGRGGKELESPAALHHLRNDDDDDDDDEAGGDDGPLYAECNCGTGFGYPFGLEVGHAETT
jgi:hypothetical protein